MSFTEDLFNVPNSITLFRIFFFLPLGMQFLVTDKITALVAVIVAFFVLDKVDGYFARRLNQVTTIGKSLDGFADTAGLFLIMAFFYHTNILSGLELFLIILPRLIYYVLVWQIRMKWGTTIHTYLWKFNLMVWLVLFIHLFFVGHSIPVIIVYSVFIYGITTWHFVVAYRKLIYDKSSKMLAT
ncbi:CDP-alcohol phosphatidyltransferase family protein [Nanoarchaeota archaeon]